MCVLCGHWFSNHFEKVSETSFSWDTVGCVEFEINQWSWSNLVLYKSLKCPWKWSNFVLWSNPVYMYTVHMNFKNRIMSVEGKSLTKDARAFLNNAQCCNNHESPIVFLRITWSFWLECRVRSWEDSRRNSKWSVLNKFCVLSDSNIYLFLISVHK